MPARRFPPLWSVEVFHWPASIDHSELLPPLAASRIIRASAPVRSIRGVVLAYIHLQTVRGDRAAKCLALSLLRNVTSGVGLASPFFRCSCACYSSALDGAAVHSRCGRFVRTRRLVCGGERLINVFVDNNQTVERSLRRKIGAGSQPCTRAGPRSSVPHRPKMPDTVGLVISAIHCGAQ
jgi:hypothetical protein